MVIKTLVENTALTSEFVSEHGLSLYIEVNNYKLLLDVGASDRFIENAVKLGVNIEDIDILIISHGHYDHGGGLKAFLDINKKAEVYIHKRAFDDYFATRENERIEYIGLDKKLKENRQIIFTSDRFFIREGISLFSNIEQNSNLPESNKGLLMDGGKDTFIHEQVLILKEDEKTILITGCSHNGVENIMEHYKKHYNEKIDYFIGGFHLQRSKIGKEESDDKIIELAQYLDKENTKYLTCHCTGVDAYAKLKNVLKNKIEYLSAGSVVNI